ncbi:MAG: cupin domain-containing protein [Spirosomataceae bacterium]
MEQPIHLAFEKTLVADDELPWEIVDEKIRRKIMSYTNELMLVKVAFLQGGIGTAHHHPHLQMSYVASGLFEITIGEECKTLKAGDVYFVPSDVVHGAVCLEDGLLIDVFNPMRQDFVQPLTLSR